MSTWKGIPIVTCLEWPSGIGPGFITTRERVLKFTFTAPDCDYMTIYLPVVPVGNPGEIRVRHYGTRFTEEVADERTGP